MTTLAALLAATPAVAAALPQPELPVEVSVLGAVAPPPAQPWCASYLSPVLTWSDSVVTVGLKACSDGLRQTTHATWWTGLHRYDSDTAEPFTYFTHEGGCTAGGSRYLYSVRECQDTYTLRASDLLDLDTAAGSFGHGFVTEGSILLDDVDASRYISYDLSCTHSEANARYVDCQLTYYGSWYHS